MSLPQAARWKVAADKEIASLKKHGVYELVPVSSVPAVQKVVSSPCVNKIKADDLFKSRLVVAGMGAGTWDRLRRHFRTRL